MLNAGQPLKRIDLSTVERHPPIVGTALALAAASRLVVETAPALAAAPPLVWHTEDDTAAFAARLAGSPAVRNAFIELHGDLGAGKTTLVRHLLRALGVTGRIKSPTYAVVEPHEAPATPAGAASLAIWHFDFYRFNDPREWEEAGFRDLFASPGLKIAEWPEKAVGVLPVADLVLHIETQPDECRVVKGTAHTAAGRTLLKDAFP